MKIKLPFILFISLCTFGANAQITDYSNVVFNSKIYEYKKSEPRTHELGINKKVLIDIIDLLGGNLYTGAQKTEIINKVWLAFTNPKIFDFVYKDFAVNTIKSWSKVNAKGEIVLEPNPYLSEWTMNDSEFTYFQLALRHILIYYNLLTYGDDADGVKSSFNELLITEKITFRSPNDDDWAYSYLTTINVDLKKKGLIALITKGDYDIIVCKKERENKIIDLFEKIGWDFIQP